MSPNTLARTVACLLAAATALALPGCMLGTVHLEQETRQVQVEHAAAAPLRVRTTNGRVEIKADPAAADVRVVADLKAQSIDRLERTAVTTTREPDGALLIAVDWADGRALNSEGCSFDVVVPDARGVEVHTGNGRVRLDSLSGDALVRTSNGRIEIVNQGGNVDADTSNGAVSITAPAGRVVARSSNGAISITDAPQSVDADTSNGRIEISLTPDAPGPVRADSSNGRIELALGRGFLGRLTLRTSNSRINADESLGAVTQMRTLQIRNSSGTIDFGQGGPESTLSTSNGAINVRPRQ